MLTAEQITEHVLRERLSLTAYIGSITRNYHLAEDVFQEICVKVIGRTEEFDSPEHLLNWFRRSARNRAIDLIRAREGRFIGLSPEALAILEEQWDRDDEFTSGEAMAVLSDCIEELTPRSREILRMRYHENRSGKDVAARLDRKVESIYQAIARIHKSLGDCVRRRTAEVNP